MIIDIFAGPGGWDECLLTLGRSDVIGIEWEKYACATEDAQDVPLVRPDGRRFYIDNEGRRDDVGHGRKAS